LRDDDVVNSSQESSLIDPSLVVSSYCSNRSSKGQLHLLWKKGKPPVVERFSDRHVHLPTRLVIRKVKCEHNNNNSAAAIETHMYAVRKMEEQRPREPELRETEQQEAVDYKSLSPQELFLPQAMAPAPTLTIPDWVIVSKELSIFVVDSGLTPNECDALVALTERQCRGQYAAYTYAKQTLGCRDYPQLATACYPAVHRVTHAIQNTLSPKLPLQLDEREPHVVKYDISKKERQKLDMHTDKSEWTFLISLSDGCGLDYEGGGTYFEALEATIHVQRGHALVFPGKLRHCGQRISKGVRFLLVGFLVDAVNAIHSSTSNMNTTTNTSPLGTSNTTNTNTTTTTTTTVTTTRTGNVVQVTT
jgi:hypothetical protein